MTRLAKATTDGSGSFSSLRAPERESSHSRATSNMVLGVSTGAAHDSRLSYSCPRRHRCNCIEPMCFGSRVRLKYTISRLQTKLLHSASQADTCDTVACGTSCEEADSRSAMMDRIPIQHRLGLAQGQFFSTTGALQSQKVCSSNLNVDFLEATHYNSESKRFAKIELR